MAFRSKSVVDRPGTLRIAAAGGHVLIGTSTGDVSLHPTRRWPQSAPLWTCAQVHKHATTQLPAAVNCVAFSPISNVAISGGADGCIYAFSNVVPPPPTSATTAAPTGTSNDWTPPTPTLVCRVTGEVHAVWIGGPDGLSVILGGDSLRLLSLATSSVTNLPLNVPPPIVGIAVAPDYRCVAVASAGNGCLGIVALPRSAFIHDDGPLVLGNGTDDVTALKRLADAGGVGCPAPTSGIIHHFETQPSSLVVDSPISDDTAGGTRAPVEADHHTLKQKAPTKPLPRDDSPNTGGIAPLVIEKALGASRRRDELAMLRMNWFVAHEASTSSSPPVLNMPPPPGTAPAAKPSATLMSPAVTPPAIYLAVPSLEGIRVYVVAKSGLHNKPTLKFVAAVVFNGITDLCVGTLFPCSKLQVFALLASSSSKHVALVKASGLRDPKKGVLVKEQASWTVNDAAGGTLCDCDVDVESGSVVFASTSGDVTLCTGAITSLKSTGASRSSRSLLVAGEVTQGTKMNPPASQHPRGGEPPALGETLQGQKSSTKKPHENDGHKPAVSSKSLSTRQKEAVIVPDDAASSSASDGSSSSSVSSSSSSSSSTSGADTRSTASEADLEDIVDDLVDSNANFLAKRKARHGKKHAKRVVMAAAEATRGKADFVDDEAEEQSGDSDDDDAHDEEPSGIHVDIDGADPRRQPGGKRRLVDDEQSIEMTEDDDDDDDGQEGARGTADGSKPLSAAVTYDAISNVLTDAGIVPWYVCQPGQTPVNPDDGSQWLAYNAIGAVRKGADGAVTVLFHDRAMSTPYRLNVKGACLMSALGPHGAAFVLGAPEANRAEGGGRDDASGATDVAAAAASVMDDWTLSNAHRRRVYFRHFQAFVGGRQDWMVQLNDGEDVLVLAVGKRHVAVFTTMFLRIFTAASGLETTCTSVNRNVVTAVGLNNTMCPQYKTLVQSDPLAVVYQTSKQGDHMLFIYDMEHHGVDITFASPFGSQSGRAAGGPSQGVFLPLTHRHAASNGDQGIDPYPLLLPNQAVAHIEWIGWSNDGFLCVSDTGGVVRMLVQEYGTSWIPIYDGRLKRNAANAAAVPRLWFWGIGEDRLWATKCPPGTNYPPVEDALPVADAVHFLMPILPTNPTGAIDRTFVLRQQYLWRRAKANTLKSAAVEYTDELSAADAELDRMLLSAFDTALKNDRPQRALDLITSFELLSSLGTAARMASEAKQLLVADRIMKLIDSWTKSRKRRRCPLPAAGTVIAERERDALLRRYAKECVTANAGGPATTSIAAAASRPHVLPSTGPPAATADNVAAGAAPVMSDGGGERPLSLVPPTVSKTLTAETANAVPQAPSPPQPPLRPTTQRMSLVTPTSTQEDPLLASASAAALLPAQRPAAQVYNPLVGKPRPIGRSLAAVDASTTAAHQPPLPSPILAAPAASIFVTTASAATVTTSIQSSPIRTVAAPAARAHATTRTAAPHQQASSSTVTAVPKVSKFSPAKGGSARKAVFAGGAMEEVPTNVVATQRTTDDASDQMPRCASDPFASYRAVLDANALTNGDAMWNPPIDGGYDKAATDDGTEFVGAAVPMPVEYAAAAVRPAAAINVRLSFPPNEGDADGVPPPAASSTLLAALRKREREAAADDTTEGGDGDGGADPPPQRLAFGSK